MFLLARVRNKRYYYRLRDIPVGPSALPLALTARQLQVGVLLIDLSNYGMLANRENYCLRHEYEAPIFPCPAARWWYGRRSAFIHCFKKMGGLRNFSWIIGLKRSQNLPNLNEPAYLRSPSTIGCVGIMCLPWLRCRSSRRYISIGFLGHVM